jgi:hypothetical protein
MAPILRVVSSEISPRVMIEFLYSIQRGGDCHQSFSNAKPAPAWVARGQEGPWGGYRPIELHPKNIGHIF